MNNPNEWKEWFADFRQRFIAAQKWDEKEARLRIKDDWVCVRDGKVQFLDGSNKLPADAVPVFQFLTPGGWKVPLRVQEQLTRLVERALTSERSPRDILLGLLSKIEHADGADESEEIRQKRHQAAYWGRQLLDACEDPALADVVELDVFWQAVLYAFQAGRRHTILELYRNPQLLSDQAKAQAFQTGRTPDKLTRRLEASFLAMRVKLGRSPKPREVAEASGGNWSNTEACWQFEELGLVSHRGLCERLKDIRRRHRSKLF
jgi:hypothetical protein